MEQLKELRQRLESYITYTQKKIDGMKSSGQADHRNIERFEGEVNMALKTIMWIDKQTQ